MAPLKGDCRELVRRVLTQAEIAFKGRDATESVPYISRPDGPRGRSGF